MIDAGSGLDLASRDTYRRWTTVSIRFGDQDSMGHVNNVIYARWIESARVPLIHDVVAGEADLDTVLASLTVDYLRETRYPGEVEVGARLASIGRRSFTSAYGVFRGDECFATATCVNVFFDTAARRSVEPPPRARAALEALLEPARSPPGGTRS